LTLPERDAFEICPVCFWEDDGQDDLDADEVSGGPNGSLSLTQARLNFREFGACEHRVLPYVGAANPDEI
jgi:Cysteine-rich CPCC